MGITIILSLTLFSLFFLGSCNNVLAQENNIGYSKIHPASPLYFLKAIRENTEMALAQTQSVKTIRRLEFATRRLREAKTLLTNSQDLIPPTLERYIAHLNSLTDKHQPNDQFAPILKNSLVIHLQTLEQIYDQALNLRAKMAIRSAMNRIIQRADVPTSAKVPVCDFFLKEASSSALNQTEKVVLLQRATSCFKSSRPF